MLPFPRCVSLSPLIRAPLTALSVWGVIWLIIAFCFFAAGILVGLAAFKVNRALIHHNRVLTSDLPSGICQPAGRGLEALPARAWILRSPVELLIVACCASQHCAINIPRFMYCMNVWTSWGCGCMLSRRVPFSVACGDLAYSYLVYTNARINNLQVWDLDPTVREEY